MTGRGSGVPNATTTGGRGRSFNASRGTSAGGTLTEAAGIGVRAAPSGAVDLWAPIGPSVVLGSDETGSPRVTGRVNDVWVEPSGGVAGLRRRGHRRRLVHRRRRRVVACARRLALGGPGRGIPLRLPAHDRVPAGGVPRRPRRRRGLGRDRRGAVGPPRHTRRGASRGRRAPRRGPVDQAGRRSRVHRRGHEPARCRHLPAGPAARRPGVRRRHDEGARRASERDRSPAGLDRRHRRPHRLARCRPAVHRRALDPAGRGPAGTALGRPAPARQRADGALVASRGRGHLHPGRTARRCRRGASGDALLPGGVSGGRHHLGTRRRPAGVAHRRHRR